MDLTFEAAVDAVVNGDETALLTLLREHPALVRAHSAHAHEATLLHYVAANGVEQHRQRTPPNAVAIATILLSLGAQVDALARMYGGQKTTLNLLVSSVHPAKAGVQVALAGTLLDFGAAIDGSLETALAFGYIGAAETLVRRGARVNNLAAAAGLGWLDDVRRMLQDADGMSRHRALALAAQHGHVEIVRLLLDAGEDPNRYNPEGNHAHSTPLHQAMLAGHDAVARLLVERGARQDLKDRIYSGTPSDWALYGKSSDERTK